MDNEEDEDKESKPSFRIRFTITSSGKSPDNFCNDIHCDQSSSQEIKINPENNNPTDKRQHFRLVNPQNHKSSLFVNLSDNRLFTSPDLNNYNILESPPSTTESTISESDDFTMSQGCNFLSSMIKADRSRPVPVPRSPDIVNNGNRLAPGIDNLGLNHGGSNETLIATSSSESSRNGLTDSSPRSDVLARPLEVVITETSDIDGFSRIDIENLNLEEECKYLDKQVEYWEQKVASLEYEKCKDDVPRTLVGKVVKLRKELRDLEVQEYVLDLESCESDGFSEACEISAGKFGSNIKPGQENTAYILDAIPPSGSLQHQQYLCRASTGTDSSEYAQLPNYRQHKHRVHVRQPVAEASSDDSNSMSKSNSAGEGHPSRKHSNHHHHHQYQNHSKLDNRSKAPQVYVQYDSAKHKSSAVGPNNKPVRPNHFESDFRSNQLIISQDSSSTGSSSSPQ